MRETRDALDEDFRRIEALVIVADSKLPPELALCPRARIDLPPSETRRHSIEANRLDDRRGRRPRAQP